MCFPIKVNYKNNHGNYNDNNNNNIQNFELASMKCPSKLNDFIVFENNLSIITNNLEVRNINRHWKKTWKRSENDKKLKKLFIKADICKKIYKMEVNNYNKLVDNDAKFYKTTNNDLESDIRS